MFFSILQFLTLLLHLTTMRYFWLGNMEGRKYQKGRFFGIDLFFMFIGPLYCILGIPGTSKIKISPAWIKKGCYKKGL